MDAPFLAFLECMPDPVVVSDRDGRVVAANAEAQRTFGYSREELLGEVVEILVPERFRSAHARHRAAYAEAPRRRPMGSGLELTARRRDGSEFPVEISLAPLEREDGLFVAAAIRDVSERKRAEEAMRTSEAELGLLAAQLPAVLWTVDPDLRRTSVLGGGLAGLGRDPSANLGRTLYEAFATDDPRTPPIAAHLRALTGESAEYELRIDERDFEVRVEPLRDAQGSIVGAIGLAVDATERKQLVALRESERHFRSLIEHSSDIIAVVGLDTLVRYASPSIERVLGFEPDEIVGEIGLALVHPDDVTTATDALARAAGTPAGSSPFRVRLRRKDGSWCPVEGEATNALDDPGVAGIVVNARDVSEREQAEEERASLEAQLLQAQKLEAVARLAAGIAHDFNNLMTGVIGFSELVLARLDGHDSLRPSVEQIKQAGERAAALTKHLLAFSRRQVLQPEVLDPNVVVAETETLLRRLLGEDIDLVVALRPRLGSVRTDRSQLEQVIVNLAVNARDAMPNGGRLTIGTEIVELGEDLAHRHLGARPGTYVVLAVSDTGIGMDGETRSHIFEPFFTTKEEGRGTGLGLSTVYGIVKQSGGEIWVESEPGQGTTFRVCLPRSDEAVERTRTRPGRAGALGGSETVLIVEDEELVRNIVREALEHYGYTVLEAAGGSQALALCDRYEGPIHLLIADVVMAGMSGPDLAERFRSSYPATRVLFTSGYSRNAIAGRGALDPGIAFLEKPLRPDSLARKVREMLDQVDPSAPSAVSETLRSSLRVR